MQTITVKYVNFFGEEVEEKLHFHLSKSELMNMAYASLGEDRNRQWR